MQGTRRELPPSRGAAQGGASYASGYAEVLVLSVSSTHRINPTSDRRTTTAYACHLCDGPERTRRARTPNRAARRCILDGQHWLTRLQRTPTVVDGNDTMSDSWQHARRGLGRSLIVGVRSACASCISCLLPCFVECGLPRALWRRATTSEPKRATRLHLRTQPMGECKSDSLQQVQVGAP